MTIELTFPQLPGTKLTMEGFTHDVEQRLEETMIEVVRETNPEGSYIEVNRKLS